MITYDPTKLLKKIAPDKKIKKLLSAKVSLKRTALSFVDDVDFIDKKSVARVALKVIKSYQERIAAEPVLTEAEQEAVGFYKTSGYGPINGQLRGNKVQNPEKAKEAIEKLDSAINKSLLKEDITVYRGMYQIRDIRALGEKGVGQELQMPTFWSASPDKKIAEGFTLANSSDSGVLFEIRLKKGHKALDATAGTKETELLLPRGQRYEIVGFKEGKRGDPPTYILEPKASPKKILGPQLKEEILKDPAQLIQRVQNEVIFQISGEIRSAYEGEFYTWLPSDAEEPDPEHQLNYGKKFQIGDGEQPGDRYGCRCGMEIITPESELQL